MLTNTDLIELTKFRRQLHRHPELSGEEVETARTITSALKLMSPTKILTGLGGHGVAAVFESSQFAFNTIKYIGAAYLTYLAYKAFYAGKTKLGNEKAPRETWLALYRRGLIMNITNPKVTIFFLALLPQFVDPKLGQIVSQFYQLGGLMIMITIFMFSSFALLASFLGKWLRNSNGAMLWMNKFAGIIFILLATKLVLAQK